MVKLVIIASVALAVLIADVTCQRYVLPTLRTPTNHYPTIIQPTYRPPVTRGPIIRTVREASDDEPLWLWRGDNIERAPATGDHAVLSSVIDDVKLNPDRRHARSVDSPSAKRHGGHTSSGGSRDTGATHPGYNRRNTRGIVPADFDPFRPIMPDPYNPSIPRPRHPRGPYPIYARTVRDIHIPGLKKPSHRDVIIPNWNPNVRTQPWQRIGGARKSRSVDQFDDEEEFNDGFLTVV